MTAPPAAPRRRRDELEREPDPRQDWFAVGIWYGTLAAITWPRTRGAATLGLAVLLTRVLGARAKRLEDTVAYLFRQRASIIDRVDAIESVLEHVDRYSEGQRMNAEEIDRLLAEVPELKDLIVSVRERAVDLELVATELAGEHVRENTGGPLRLLGIDVKSLSPAARAALARVRDRALPF